MSLTPVPLTSSPLSSINSYATATASPQNHLGTNTPMDLSTPVEADDTTNTTIESFAKASKLPLELKTHCQVYLEENLYLITLNLLNSLLSSTCHNADDTSYCPSTSQLSLISSAIVHPKFTTRPREEGWDEVSAESLIYLRGLLARLGPINGRFKEAFRFITVSRHNSPEYNSGDDSNHSTDDDGGDATYAHIKRSYHLDSLWRRGQDFFHVVGWAFNCSVLYPNRWRHWKNWLKFMLDLLEQDLAERHKLDMESGKPDYPMLSNSILASYVSQRSGRSTGGLKIIMEAIFADGSVTASSHFQEIWVKEHKEAPQDAAKKRKRETVNIEKGNFGGYLDDESVYSSQTSEPPTPQKRKTHSGNLRDSDFQALEPAYVESIPLRQRLFSLLSYLCHYLPSPMLDFSDLYQRYERTVKSLPLPIFTAFVDNTSSALRLESQVSTLQGITLLLMPASALSPAKVDRTWQDADGLTSEILERCFLPYPANTIALEDNAKVSILLENMLQIMWRDSTDKFGQGLRMATEKGIAARDAKVKRKKTSARGRIHIEDPDVEARAVLEMSGQRLVTLVDLIEADDEVLEEIEVEPMDEDGEDEESNEDDKIYCLCRRKQSGDMIACDNSTCPYEWFHWRCVKLKSVPEFMWLCPDCSKASNGRGSKAAESAR